MRRRVAIGTVVGAMLLLGCHGDTTGPALMSSDHLYWRFVLNHHAITMALAAPYNTLQLQGIAQSVEGDTLPDTTATTYTSSDSSKVAVSATGGLTALKAAKNIVIVAAHQHAGITLVDTAYVNVNNVTTIPTFTTMTLQPPPDDSAVFSGLDIAWYNSKTLLQQTLDQNGSPIGNVVVRYYIANSLIVIFGGSNLNSTLYPHSFGATMVTSEATIYGVRRVDSLRVAVDYPEQVNVEVLPEVKQGTTIGYFYPGSITVQAGAVVAWYSYLTNGQPMDVVFDTPGAVAPEDSTDFSDNFFLGWTWYNGAFQNAGIPEEGGGNIAPFTQDSVCTQGGTFVPSGYGFTNCTEGAFYYLGRARRFPTVGDYPYHSTLYGTGGVVHVVPGF